MKIKLIYSICVVTACPIYANYPAFVGDLIARDLKNVGPVGHVGIASASYYKMRPTIVLEAMDTTPHIQANSIDDFKSRTKYWGSKGGLLTPQSIESYTVANRLVRQYFACPEYSYTWRWKEGKIDNNTKPISCAIFRCDTLVNYGYAFSEGYSLPSYNTTWTTPIAIYNYFPIDTDLLISERNNSFSTPQNIIYDTVDSINENKLKELNSEVFYQMLQNSPNISKEQIIYLWKLFTSNEIDNKIKILFYDFISFENPDYLTDKIIKQAKKENGELRHRLLVILQSIYQEKLRKNETSGLKELIDYFEELELQNLDKNDGGIVYRGLATLTSRQLEIKKVSLSNMDKIHVDILSLQKERNNEIKYINDIIYNLDHPDDRLVITASYQYFTHLLINSDLKFFSEESKKIFREHLERKKIIDLNQSMLYTSAYIEFKAALNARDPENIPKLAFDYMQGLDPEIQKSTFYGFSDFIKNKTLSIN